MILCHTATSSLDIKCYPVTHHGQISSYIWKTKAFEAEYTGPYKVKKVYPFFESGMVGKIYVCCIENGKIIKILMILSKRISDKKHRLWILFNEASDIVTSFYTCTAGFSFCFNHAVAALCKIEYTNEKGLKNLTCTEQLCSWNNSSKEVTLRKVKDLVITEHNQQNQNKKKCLNYKERYGFDPYPEN